MPRLEIEITDQLMEKLQKRAELYAVEPSDVAKSIISCELVRREKPYWLDNVTAMVSQMSAAVVAASKMGTKNPEQE